MEDKLYKIIFEGHIQSNFREKVVKKNLQLLFNADKAKMKRLFSGTSVILRKNLSEEKVREFEKALVKAGAVCKILSVKGEEVLPPLTPEAMVINHDMEPITASRQDSHSDDNTPFHPSNRLGRIQYLALGWLVFFFECGAWLLPDYLPQILGSILTIQQTLLTIAGFHTMAGITLLIITGMRLHDLNRSAWLWLFLIIPGLNLLFLLWLVLVSGSKNWNSFGRPPAEPGNLVRLFGLWIPLLLVITAGVSGWLHLDEIVLLVDGLPDMAHVLANAQQLIQ